MTEAEVVTRATYAVVALTFMSKDASPQVTVKLADDEDHAKRELERMVLTVIPNDTTQTNVRRGPSFATVKTHQKNGQPGATYRFSIEIAGEACAP